MNFSKLLALTQRNAASLRLEEVNLTRLLEQGDLRVSAHLG